MADTLTLAGLSLTTNEYRSGEPFDTGGNELAAALLTGDLRMEEYDQYLAELRFVRPLSIGLKIRQSTLALSISSAQAITSILAAANRYSPVDLVFTPQGGNASTFKVIGGGLQHVYTRKQQNQFIVDAVLACECLPWVYGASQAIGSSGSPIITNTSSPALLTVTPTGPVGDVPADITLFVKNRSASAIRSLIVSSVSGNTTWTPLSDNAGWTADTWAFATAAGSQFLGTDKYSNSGTPTANTPTGIAHFTAPSTLTSDRRYRLLMRMYQVGGPPATEVRARLVSGSTQVTGEFVSVPTESYGTNDFNLVELGSFYLPPGNVGSVAGAATTVYIEGMSSVASWPSTTIDYCLFVPEDSTIIFETDDSSKTLAAASGIVQVESNQLYDSTGAQLGGDIKGSHLRARGTTRFMVHTSQGYMGAIGSPFYGFENVDVWATYTPRYIHLA